MDWSDWIGREHIFVKLDDGQVFSNCQILAYEDPFLSLTDKFGLPVVINTNHILKIKEERDDGTK